MGNKAPIDIAQTLDAYLYRMIRIRSESMVAYSSREEEAYNKLMNSYKRLKADATNIFCQGDPLLLRNCGLQPSEKANVWSTAEVAIHGKRSQRH